jgi:hypothetical protein
MDEPHYNSITEISHRTIRGDVEAACCAHPRDSTGLLLGPSQCDTPPLSGARRAA